MKRILLIMAFFLVFLLESEAQCAMCRAVLESGEGQDIGKSVNRGIQYLMIFPYLLIAGLGIYIYRKYRNT